MRRWWLNVVLLLVGATAALGNEMSFQLHAAVMDSLHQMPRWEQVRWLAKRGLPDPYLRDLTPTEDNGLRCAGRWSYGPSTWVDVRATADDTIVFLSRGSGASVIRFRSQDSLRLDLLSDINSHGLTGRCQVRDTLLYVNSGGVECYDVSDLSQPVLLNWLSQPLMYDFFVVDTLLHTSSRDSLRIFSVANPASPRWLGSCADSGYVMYVAGGHAYLGHQAGLFILDVSNPTSPHRVASLGYDVLSIAASDTLLYFGTTEFALRAYNVADPATPFPVGSLTGIEAHDIYLPPTCDTVLYTPKLHVINIADPAHPRQIGFVNCPGWDYGVRAVPALNHALVADYFDGLVAVDIGNPVAPLVGTSVFGAGSSEDICIDNGKTYVAQYFCGMRILDISDPARPQLLGAYDTVGQTPPTRAIAARDSFAYFGWTWPPYLHAFGVSNPAKPVMYGGVDITNPPEDMVLRDSLLYVAEIARFQIVNVARPREPVLVGSCVIQGTGVDLLLQDTLAYVSSLPTQIVNVGDPTGPVIVGTIPTYGHGIAIRDSFAFVPALYDSMVIYNVRDPSAPVRVARHTFSGGHVWNSGIALVGGLLYVGGDIVHVVDVADPLNPVEVGTWMPPYETRRLCYAAPYLYAASYDAGVCILETVPTGLEESSEKGGITKEVWLSPSVTTGRIAVEAWVGADRLSVCLYGASGAKVKELQASTAGSGTRLRFELNLSGFPDGIYFVNLKGNDRSFTTKVVKTKGR